MSMVTGNGLTEDRVIQLAQRAAIEAVRHANDRQPTITAKAGTVTDVADEATADSAADPVVNQAYVVLDGAEEAVPADSITAHPVRPGDRVYLLHVPPHAFVIIGRIRVDPEVEDVAPLEGVIVQDTPGSMSFYDPDGNVVARQSTIEWTLGNIDPPGHRVTLDPVGGIRFRSETDVMLNQIEQGGITLRDESSGLVVAEFKGGTTGSIRLVDPSGTDDIEMVTSSIGTLPNPKIAGPLPEANPSSSIVAPAAALFTTTPADDYELYHAAAFLAGTSQTGTWTPPGGATERADTNHPSGTSTLSVGIADRDPASGVAGTFTSSQTNWLQGLGTHIVIRGGGATSPSFRAISEATFGPTSATSVSASVAKPTGTAAGDALIALVAMGNEGGTIPTGWTTPEGWEFLGANFLLAGSGASLSCLAVGAWRKLATASEPSDYEITVTFGGGSKRIHAAIVAVQNPYLIAGGAHIRMSGHPIRRLLAATELTAASATLCDFQNIVAGYDHLEIQWDAKSDRATDVLRNMRMRLNADAGTNYRWAVARSTQGAAVVTTGDGVGTQDRAIIGGIDGGAIGSTTSGVLQILGYSRVGKRRNAIGTSMFVHANGNVDVEHTRFVWLNTADAVNRVGISVDSGTTLFDAGSRAFLYGY